MKHTLEEIEKMLAEISPWPWESGLTHCYITSSKIISHINERAGIARIAYPDFDRGTSDEQLHTDFQFIASSPEIISDLVEEVKELKRVKKIMFETINDFNKENKRLREALEFYAQKNNYPNPSHPIATLNDNGDIDPNSICGIWEMGDVLDDFGNIARKALEGK